MLCEPLSKVCVSTLIMFMPGTMNAPYWMSETFCMREPVAAPDTTKNSAAEITGAATLCQSVGIERAISKRQIARTPYLLRKPYDPDELLHAIRDALDNRAS